MMVGFKDPKEFIVLESIPERIEGEQLVLRSQNLSQKEAKAYAERLASENPKNRYYVAQLISCTETRVVITRSMMGVREGD
jgi:hypothetical protein